MQKVAVVIPVYKENPSENERKSFEQCVRVLQSHPLFIITHKQLNISYYLEICPTLHILYFDFSYFANIKGYNQLLLSTAFYQRFMAYEYMLIYQLDAYVFSDDLSAWCDKGFDYIGAPWVKEFGRNQQRDLWLVGNGGLSLRNNKRFIGVLSGNKKVFSFSYLYRAARIDKKSVGMAFAYALLRSTGYHNNTTYIIQDTIQENRNEDWFWSWIAPRIDKRFHTPSPTEALAFSIESFPSHYCATLPSRLPFGCHAWEKNEPEFWLKYIK